MTILLALDDTDMPGTRGTGKLARQIAAQLSPSYNVAGITRHQLFVHSDIPYTSHNSCAVLHIETSGDKAASEIFSLSRDAMLDSFIEGSDPGLAISETSAVPTDITEYGIRAKKEVLNRKTATDLAKQHGIRLEGLGGSNDGIIGSLAGIGLAAGKNDGRFVMKGKLRSIWGEQSVDTLKEAGIDRIMTPEGKELSEGIITLQKFPKPAQCKGESVLFVVESEGRYWDVVVG